MHYFTWKLGLVSNILWLIVDDMKKTWRKKLLHGRYTLRTVNGDADRTTTHQWLSRSSLKGETQCFELAAHDQSLATRIYQAKILKNRADPRSQLCAHNEETIGHDIRMFDNCKHKIHSTRRRNSKILHWTLCKYYEMPHTKKGCQHAPESVVEGKIKPNYGISLFPRIEK